MQPPAPEAAIDREAKALEDAIARLELEQAGATAPEPELAPPAQSIPRCHFPIQAVVYPFSLSIIGKVSLLGSIRGEL